MVFIVMSLHIQDNNGPLLIHTVPSHRCCMCVCVYMCGRVCTAVINCDLLLAYSITYTCGTLSLTSYLTCRRVPLYLFHFIHKVSIN